MSFSIKILQSNIDISRQINKSLAEDIRRNLKKNENVAVSRVKYLIPFWIKEQPEITSILDEGIFGSLNAQFGFIQGTASEAVDAICFSVANAVQVEFYVKDNLEGGITLNFQPNDFYNVLGIPQANIPALSGPLPWLHWLLTQGTATIISGYEYKPDNSGRSGGGTMTSGRAWRVPPQFSGTLENNFITRALQNREKELTSILEEALYA